MISLRDNGILERAEVTVTGDYTDQVLAGMYNAVTGAVVVGGIAAIEAVAGRVASMLSVARIEGGPRARQALTPTVLSMIGRNLIEAGESLHLVKARYADGTIYLAPAQRNWVVEGGIDPEAWAIRATVVGAMTIMEKALPREAWFHIIRDADPDYPWRGVSPLQRATVTTALASAAEDSLLRESRIPSKAIIPMPQGIATPTQQTIRQFLTDSINNVVLPETTAGGFGSGRTSAPLADWKPQRLRAMPEAAQVQAASDAQARVVAALGCHPAIIGGGSGNGSVDREAVKQFRHFLMQPIARLLEENAVRAFGERITVSWPATDDTMLIKARTADALVKLGVDPQAALKIARVTTGPVKMAPKPEPPPPMLPPKPEGEE